MMGEREIAGDVTIDFMLPDKMRRTDSFGIPGGPTMERVSVLNGGEVWDDSTNRGGGGFMMRMGGGPGGPGGPGGRELTEEEKQRMRDMQTRRMKAELARHALAFLMRTNAAITYAGRGRSRRRQGRRPRDQAGRRHADEDVHRPGHPPAADADL